MYNRITVLKHLVCFHMSGCAGLTFGTMIRKLSFNSEERFSPRSTRYFLPLSGFSWTGGYMALSLLSVGGRAKHSVLVREAEQPV